MRSTEERVLEVQKRSRRLRRQRVDRALASLVFLMAFPLVDLMGRYAAGDLTVASAAEGGLFGAASLFGASAGGYVLVAVVAAVVAVAVTVFLMMRRRAREEKRSGLENPTPSSDETDLQAR